MFFFINFKIILAITNQGDKESVLKTNRHTKNMGRFGQNLKLKMCPFCEYIRCDYLQEISRSTSKVPVVNNSWNFAGGS